MCLFLLLTCKAFDECNNEHINSPNFSNLVQQLGKGVVKCGDNDSYAKQIHEY